MTLHRALRNASRSLPLLVGIIASGCIDKPAAPLAPTWDVNMTAPLSRRTFTLAELVDRDTSLLSVMPGGTQIIYRTSVQTDPTAVGDLITLSPFNTVAGTQLGPFAMSPSSVTTPIPVPAVAGMPVPPASNIAIGSIGADIPGIQEVTFKSGTVTLTITNTLPAAMVLDAPISFRDDRGGLIGQFVFADPSIPSGGQRTSTIDLAEKLVTAHVVLADISISTPGSGMTPVQAANRLTASLGTANLVARSALLSQVPAQTLADNAVIQLPLTDSTRVREVRLRSGSLMLQFRSHVEVDMFFRYRFPQIFRPNGTAYVDSVNLPAGGTANRTINLAGHTIRSLNGAVLTALDVVSSVNMFEGSRGLAVRVSETDSVGVTASSTTVVADSAVAILKPTLVSIDQSVALPLGELRGKFHGQMSIPSASLRFTPRTSIDFPVQTDLRFEARNELGQIISTLPVPNKQGGSGKDPIDFVQTDVGAFLSGISGTLPDSIRVRGTVLINPNYDQTSPCGIGRHSGFGGDLDLGIPLSLSIQGGSLSDTTEMGDTTGDGHRDNRIDQKTLDGVNSATVHVEMENSLPFGVVAKLTLLNMARQPVLVIPQSAGDSITVAAGVVSNGDVVAPTAVRRDIRITGTEAQAINVADLVTYSIRVMTGGTGPVNLRTTDSIRFRVWVEVSEKVNQ
jgi:hypothetical protein